MPPPKNVNMSEKTVVCEYLIELVRSRRCLYDMRNPSYKDTHGVKLDNWKDVAQLMVEAGCPRYNDVDAVIKKWTNIRDGYAAAIARHERMTRCGAPASRPNPWHLFEQMRWYDDFTWKKAPDRMVEVARGNASDACSPSTELICYQATPKAAPCKTARKVSPTTSPPFHAPMMSGVKPPSNGKKRALMDPVDERVLGILDKLQEKFHPEKEMDECDHLGTVVASQLRSLTARKRAKFMIGIQEAFVVAMTSKLD